MLTLLAWRKVIGSVIFPLIPFVFHCNSCRQLVGVGVESGPGIISISEAEVGAAVPASAAPSPKRRFGK